MTTVSTAPAVETVIDWLEALGKQRALTDAESRRLERLIYRKRYKDHANRREVK